MPVFDSTTEDKIIEIRGLRRLGVGIETHELVMIDWPSPGGPVYYAVHQTDDVASVPPAVSPIVTRLIPGDDPAWFMPVTLDATIGDEEVDLQFGDLDGTIADLLYEHGEGVRVELFYWFPQVELLLPLWHGHLRYEDDTPIDVINLKAVQGFRSCDANCPSRGHYEQCSAVFGGLLATQAEINDHDCPFNFHIGGGIGNNDPSTGQPWTYCDRRDPSSCTARGVNPLFHLSHFSSTATVQLNSGGGPNLYSTSQGNETNLKEPVRVVMGTRRIRDMRVMNYRKDPGISNPAHGWFRAFYEVCEEPVEQISNVVVKVGNVYQNADGDLLNVRTGGKGLASLDLSMTAHGYSGLAHFRYVFGHTNPAEHEPEDASASARIVGLNNIRVYTDFDSYTEIYTNNRAWQIARILCDKRWGFGYDYERLDIDSWIAAAEWCAPSVTFTDPFGTEWNHVRAQSDVELIGKKVQQQIDDMCVAGRLSRPFLFNGKIHIAPLAALTEDELDECPVFTDEGEDRNIIWEGEPGEEKTTLTRSRLSDLDLPNRIECTYDSAAEDYLEQPLAPVEDVDAQLRAGRVVGDGARKINPKKVNLLGVTLEPHALKLAWSFLDLGEFDEGGLQNNLRLKFKIWFIDALDLYPTKVIKVLSSPLTRFGFTFFRVMKINRLADLQVELEVQAYNETYMETFETAYTPPPADVCSVGSHWDPDLMMCVTDDPPQCRLEFGDVSYENGVLSVQLEEC